MRQVCAVIAEIEPIASCTWSLEAAISSVAAVVSSVIADTDSRLDHLIARCGDLLGSSRYLFDLVRDDLHCSLNLIQRLACLIRQF